MPKLLLEGEQEGKPLPGYPCELMFRVIGQQITWRKRGYTLEWNARRGQYDARRGNSRYVSYSEPKVWYYRSEDYKLAIRQAKKLEEEGVLMEFSFSHLHWRPVPMMAAEELEEV